MEDHSVGDGWPGQVIQQAVLYDNVELLQCLLEGEELANINATDACGRTAVYTAVSNNSLRCLRLLLEHGGNPNIAAGERCRSMTPLHLAVLDSKHEVLKQLLQFGVNLTPVDESGQTPLALARVIGNSTSVTLLENEQEKRMEVVRHLSSMSVLITELCVACKSGRVQAVQAVLDECGARREHVLNMIPDHGLPPLCCASNAGSLELVELLLMNGASPVCQRGTGLSPLHLACSAGHTHVVQRLLQEYPDLVMARSIDHCLPLHVAAAQSKVDTLQCLLNHVYPDTLLQTFDTGPSPVKYRAGFDVNAQDSLGKMALHVACERGFKDNVTALLNFSVKISEEEASQCQAKEQGEATPTRTTAPFPRPSFKMSKSRSRESVLSHSSFSLRDPSVHNLQNQSSSPHWDFTPTPGDGVDEPFTLRPVMLNHRSSEGLSPLHYAIKHHHYWLVHTLIHNGADITQEALLKDRSVTPLAFAFEQNELDVMRLLLEVGVEDAGNHVLQGAFISQDSDVVALLLQFKSVKDPVHAIKKTELWKMSGHTEHSKLGSLDRPTQGEGDVRPKSLASAVAIHWQGLSALRQIQEDCLAKASLRLNPALRNLEPAKALCAITKVDISGNSFETFPECLLMLPSLVVLNVSKNSIKELPDEDDNLSISFMCPALEEFHMQQNKLQTLPMYVFRFPSLKYLDVSYNSVKELPSEMWLAPSLITFDLTRNALTKLPVFSKELSIPRRMSLAKRMSGGSYGGSVGVRRESNSGSPSASSNDMDGSAGLLDESVDNVDVVNCCDVTTNEVVHVNKWGTSLRVVDRDPWKNSGGQAGLQQLKLSRNKITTFPTCLPCLAPYLEVLDLSDNLLDGVIPISDMPPYLKELSLVRCGLTTLEPWRKKPEVAKDTSCFGTSKTSTYNATRYSNSPSSRLSPSMASRESYSSMTTACFHRSHTCLLYLEKLSVAYNKVENVFLTRLPDGQGHSADTQSLMSFGLESEELQQRLLFPALVELDLSWNHLHSLTSDIGEQATLKILSLRGNRYLKELPSKLGLLKNLWKLDLDMCPLDGVINDLMHSSRFPVRDILGFLLSVLEESTYYNSLNLMLVGCHKIGKTSLLHRLRKEGKAPSKPTHWRDRVSNEEVRTRGQTLSTVGIDINELILDCSNKGTVNFRTWDFGGQREYYATHQYFLSPRSLYLVMWSIIEGERGVEGLQQWLINIQARAPGAAVIIVGTHLDVLRDRATRRNFPPDYEEAMTGMIHKLFLSVSEPDKCGLPNVLDAINISCKTGENVRKLVDLIKNIVFELKHAKSKTVKLLGQKIPRKYLLLQVVVRELARERINDYKDPVLTRAKYMLCVSDKMMEKGFTTFRDVEELEQATRFLHENGVLFHWDDHALKDLYFLDPQWLCDQLANVITVREINNFAQRGVMRISNLEFLFRSTTFQPKDVRQYITSLLAKFEVALQFDDNHLILPSLLPVRLHPGSRRQGDTKIPMRRPGIHDVHEQSNSRAPRRFESLTRGACGQRPRMNSGPEELHIGASVFYAGSQTGRHSPNVQAMSSPSSPNLLLLAVKPCSNPIFSFCRLYFMTYFPSGFWSRLIVRILADTTLYGVVQNLFCLPEELLSKSPEVRTLADREPEWHCWQSGLELFHMGCEMVRIREVVVNQGTPDPRQVCDYSLCHFKCSVEREWCYLDTANSRILEITFPTDLLRFHVSQREGPMLQMVDLSNTTTVVRGDQATTKLLVKVVEHIDNLLQDWYPELGEIRFHQNCEGRYLVTRAVPCPRCLAKEVKRQKASRRDEESWFFVNPDAPEVYTPFVVSQDSHTSRHGSLQPSPDSPGPNVNNGLSDSGSSGHNRSLSEGQAFIYNCEDGEDSAGVIFSYLVERCMLNVMQGVDTVCPLHGSISPQHLLDSAGISHPYYIAPDVVFSDVDNEMRISNTDEIEVGKSLGEGTFGKVYEGLLHRRGGPPEPVALKILFEAERGRRTTNLQGFQMRLETACSAYLTARQEVSILERLCHDHIVPFLGLALTPLSLVLGLAPHGALSSILKTLQDAGTHLPFFVVRKVIIQVAKALTYLHSHNIIYRDLKSENVLVWDLPLSSDVSRTSHVHVKLADYGISRTVLPTGAKGFGGTPSFIAPEILQYAGKGTYSEKVDIFSLGMFIFELVTCRFPFVDTSNPNTLICQGGRPSLTTQEAERTPTYLLDLLCVSWSQEPADRPSAASVEAMVTSFQFCHLCDTLSLGPDVGILCGVAVPSTDMILDAEPNLNSPTSSEMYSQVRPCQVWLSSCTGNTSALEMFSFGKHNNTVVDYKTLQLKEKSVIAMCVVDNAVWCADEEGVLHIYDIDTLAVTHQLHMPSESPLSVLSLHPLADCGSVAVVASHRDCSLVYVCRQPQLGGVVSQAQADQFRVFKCYCSTLVRSPEGCELWLGQGSGTILVWNVTTRTSTASLYHTVDKMPPSTCCIFLVSAQSSAGDHPSSFVWSYNFPGTVVYCWDTEKRCVVERLDCSTIYSTVDSTSQGSPQRMEAAQVTALNVTDDYLYIGNTRGRIIVVDAVTMKPLTVFSAHSPREFYVRCILPILGHPDPEGEDRGVRGQCQGIVSVGRGYVDLISQGIDNPAKKGQANQRGRNATTSADGYAHHTFLLSWSTDDWEYY